MLLHDNLLSGPIPDLSSLTSLERICTSNKNLLSGEIPASLDSLTSLVHLYLQENQLTGEIPASLGNLTTLTSPDPVGQPVDRRKSRLRWATSPSCVNCISVKTS